MRPRLFSCDGCRRPTRTLVQARPGGPLYCRRCLRVALTPREIAEHNRVNLPAAALEPACAIGTVGR